MSEQPDELVELRAFVALAQEHDFDSLSLRDGDLEIEIIRRDPTLVAAPPQMFAATPAALEPQPVHHDVPSEPVPTPGTKTIEAPIIGVFYRSASPGAAPFVNIGDRVVVGQVLCILEAMKLMNEITSDYAGIITAIGSENGALVTIGSPLFTISPG